MPGEEAEPGGCFGAKTTADFDTDNNHAAATGAHELRVSLMALASCGSVDSSARVHGRTRLSLTSPGDGADNGGIYGLHAASHAKGRSVRDDFDAAVVGHRHIDVHVCQADIIRASWQTRAAARSRGRAREASTPEVAQAAL